MSEFKSVRCDECQRIQDGANHWHQLMVWYEGETVRGVLLGDAVAEAWTLTFSKPMQQPSTVETHDLCGQSCAVKHIAKLLKWNLPDKVEADGEI